MDLFSCRMALREARSSARRLGVYMTSISAGVAALVALHSFRDDVVRSIETENRSLLGADVRISGDRPLPDSLARLVDSLAAEGVVAARTTGTVSMALAPRTGRTRLVRLRGVEPGFPFYGEVETDPPGEWGRLAGRKVLLDPTAMAQLDLRVGDTVALGGVGFAVAGSVAGLPTDVGPQAIAGPRAFVARGRLAAAGLLGPGSLSRHHVYLRVGGDGARFAARLDEERGDALRSARFTLTSAEEHARSLTRAADVLADYLALVGLAALILGGVGVGSAVHVFVRGGVARVATLRCLGATRRQAFDVFLLQVAALGLLASLAGAGLGVVVQRVLPLAIRDAIPVEVQASPSPLSIALGLAAGVLISLAFALPPLLAVRRVSPLQALRRAVDAGPTRDPTRVWVAAALAATVLALAVAEAPDPLVGLGFAVGLAVVALALWAVAVLLARAARRFFPRRAPWAARQGVANLFRPGNQTVAVTLALGFGVLVVGVVLQIRSNLGRRLAVMDAAGGPNVLLFDVQADQEAGVQDLLAEHAEAPPRLVPVVTARIRSLRGRLATETLAAAADPDGPEPWTLRREYRVTYRDRLEDGEILVAGEWWDGGARRSADRLPGISLEEELAADLRVAVGDEVTWSAAGRSVRTRVASLRRVDWGRFGANFFVVFEPGAVETLPRSTVALARVATEKRRADFQEALARAYPNVSALDLETVRETVAAIASRVGAAVRIPAALSTVAGLVVMAGSVAATRSRRRREGALLRALGARRAQVRGALLSEYAALGAMAAVAGGALAILASWILVEALFDVAFVPDAGAAALLSLAVVGIVVLAGAAGGGRPSATSSPLSELRSAAE